MGIGHGNVYLLVTGIDPWDCVLTMVMCMISNGYWPWCLVVMVAWLSC